MNQTRRQLIDELLDFVEEVGERQRPEYRRAASKPRRADPVDASALAAIHRPTPYSFSTVSGTRHYALPAYFGRVSNKDGVIRNATTGSQIFRATDRLERNVLLPRSDGRGALATVDEEISDAHRADCAPTTTSNDAPLVFAWLPRGTSCPFQLVRLRIRGAFVTFKNDLATLPNAASGPSLAAQMGSRLLSAYMRSFPFQRGKERLWRMAAPSFLVSRQAGGWLRTSGLTEAEKTLFLRRDKEPLSVELLSRLLAPGMVAVDVGANIGYFTILMASRTGPTGRVHAFEPTPALAERVLLNCSLNGFSNVRVNQIALSDVTGTSKFRLSAEDPEANSLFSMEASANEIEVHTTTLFEYMSEFADGTIDVIKLDCEGAEGIVLKGAVKLLEPRAAPVLLFECNSAALRIAGTSVAEVLHALRSLSYECYVAEHLKDGLEPVWNVLAFKPVHEHAARLVAEYRLRVITPEDLPGSMRT